MSKLSEAIDGIVSAATDLKATAATMKRMTKAMEKTLLPEVTATTKTVRTVAETTSKEALAAIKAVREKAIALLGHVGADAVKVGEVIAGIREGAWLEADGVKFGDDGTPMSGRVRLDMKE